MEDKIRYEKSRRVSIIGIIVNIVLTIIKAVIGLLAGSTALVADAFHSASDLFSTVVVMQGLKIAYQPPDESHPYGHHRAESITSKILAIILMITAIGIGYESYKVLINPAINPPQSFAIYTAFLSIIVKEAMYRHTYKVGKELNSPALIADAWHHRSDAFSSIAAVIGIAGALLGYTIMDPLVGIIVAILILRTGISIYIDAIKVLMDTSPPKKVFDIIDKAARKAEGVKDIQDIKVRQYGPKYFVDIKICVDPDITVEAGHAIAGKAKHFIINSELDILDVLVHVNPFR